MLPVPACGSKTRRWHSHRSACSAVAPGGRTPNRNRGRPCSWPSGRGPRPPPPQSAPSVFAAATRPPTAASGSQSSDRSVENCSLPGYHQGASRWRYSTPANPIKSDRLLEFSHTVMGRTAGLVFAELGADVIKIEPAPKGDHTRGLGGFGAGFFAAFNRNKRSLAVDLKRKEGQAVIHRLVPTADVILENFGPGTMERLGCVYKQ